MVEIPDVADWLPFGRHEDVVFGPLPAIKIFQPQLLAAFRPFGERFGGTIKVLIGPKFPGDVLLGRELLKRGEYPVIARLHGDQFLRFESCEIGLQDVGEGMAAIGGGSGG